MMPIEPEKSKSLQTVVTTKTVLATVLLNLFLLLLVSSIQVKALLVLWRWYSGFVSDGSPRSPIEVSPAKVVPFDWTPYLSGGEYTLRQAIDGCWIQAYEGVLPTCEIGSDKEKRSRIALALANCFLASSGFPRAHCPDSRPALECTANFPDDVHSIFVVFYNEVNSICHQLQKTSVLQTAKAPSDDGRLERPAEKVQGIGSGTVTKAEADYLVSTPNAAGAVPVGTANRIESVLAELSAIASDAQGGMETVLMSQDHMLQQQKTLADALSLELTRLQTDHADISAPIIAFLQELPELRGPPELDKNSEVWTAMDESTTSLHQLSELARLHKDGFTSWQGELDAMYQRLAHGSSELLKSQEAIAAKQSAAVESLDTLFSSYDAIVDDKKPLKTFFFYLVVACFLYFITNIRQTHRARMLVYYVFLPGTCLEVLLVLLQVTGLSKKLRTLNVELSWIRGVVTALELLGFDYKTRCLRGMALLLFKPLLVFKRLLAGSPKAADARDPLYRLPRKEQRQRHRYILREGVRRPDRVRPKTADLLNTESVEEFTARIMKGRPFDDD